MSDTEQTPAATQMPGTRLAMGSFYIAGLGASAGGLEALQSFFEAMPADSGVSFVVIQSRRSPRVRRKRANSLCARQEAPRPSCACRAYAATGRQTRPSST